MPLASDIRRVVLPSLMVAVLAGAPRPAPAQSGARGTYQDLVALFDDWRAFERPPLREGAPDYTEATLARRQAELRRHEARLGAFDIRAWPVAQQVDCNRGLPQISPVTSAAQYERRADESVTKYVGFLKKHDVLPVHAYTDAEIRKRKGEFVPPETRHFFAIATHHEPMTLYTHFYHWWDLAQMRERPHASPITCWASSSSSTCASRATARATSRASTCSRS